MRRLKFISFLLALVLVLSSFFCLASCSGGNENEIPSEEHSEEITSNEDIPEEHRKFSLSDKYNIVIPDSSTSDEVAAMRLFIDGIKSACGITLHPTSDFVRPGAEVVPGEYEILIGETNRKESAELLEDLEALNFGWSVKSENVIAICGNNSSGTYSAVESFLKSIFGYVKDESDGHSAELETGTNCISLVNPVSAHNVYINGKNISEYTIVSRNGKDTASREIQNTISVCTATEKPDIVKASDYKASEGPAIFVGCANADGGHLAKKFDAYNYYITSSGDDIIIDFTGSSCVKEVVNRFYREFLRGIDTAGTQDINITLSDEKVIAGAYVSGETNGLALYSESKRELSTGVEYLTRLYYDENGKPVRAYIITVSPGSAYYYAGTPYDDKILENRGGTVKSEMIYAVENGKNVLAGINADFFAISGNYLPTGICIKEGEVLNTGSKRPFFAFLKDGTPLILDNDEYSKYRGNIQTALGGSHIILSGGKISDVGAGTEFGTTRHPRTAIGIRNDGTVVLAVVDGRQTNTSNGASLADLASIFLDLGCNDAMNFDGGGSSCMVLRDTEKDSYTTVNSPSDGALRKIQDSLLLVIPSEE